MKLAVLAGLAVVALLGWTLWTLSSGAPLESTGKRAVIRAPGADSADGLRQDELPVAPDQLPRGDPSARPRVLAVEQAAAQGPDGVLGLILDRETGEPIPVFQVQVLSAGPGDPLTRLENHPQHSFHVLTGVFFLEKPPGNWDVVVQAPGYEPSVLTDVPTPARKRAPLRFELNRGPGLVGLVLDESFMPVAGIKTFLHVSELFEDGAKPPLVRTATTGADGRFSYSPLPAGDYAVTLLEPDNSVDRTGGLRVSGNTVSFDMYLRPRHELTLHVSSEDGSPLADVLVEARSKAAHYAHAKTNESGLALLERLPDGVYTLKASLTGLPPHSEELELFGGTSQQVRWLTLSP